jgi:nitrate reductase gamma subunit
VSQPTHPELKSFGIALVFVGLSLIPGMLFAIKIFNLYVSQQDFHTVLIVLLVLADGALFAGVMILIPRRRSTERYSEDHHSGNS